MAFRRKRLHLLKRSPHPAQHHAGAEGHHRHDQNQNGFPAHHISTNYGDSSPRLESPAKYHTAAGVFAAPEDESDVSATSTPTHGGARRRDILNRLLLARLHHQARRSRNQHTCGDRIQHPNQS